MVSVVGATRPVAVEGVVGTCEPFWEVERELGVVAFEGSGVGRSARRAEAAFVLTPAEVHEVHEAEELPLDDERPGAPVVVAVPQQQHQQQPQQQLQQQEEGSAGKEAFDLCTVAKRRLAVPGARPAKLRCVAYAFRYDGQHATDLRTEALIEQNWPLMTTTVRANEKFLVLGRQRKFYAPCEGQEKAKGFSEPFDMSCACVAGLNRVEAVARCEALEAQYHGAMRLATLFNGAAAAPPQKPLVGPAFIKDELLDARYALCVRLVREVSPAVVALRVASAPTNPTLEDCTRRALRFAADQGTDEDVCMSAASFSLRCPISLAPIRVPARGRDCTHLQCFDLQNYLDMNVRHSVLRWRCTVCAKVVTPATAVIDAFVLRLIDQFHTTGERPDSVEIDADGSIRAVTNHMNSTGGSQGRNKSGGDDGDGDSDGEHPKSRPVTSASATSSTKDEAGLAAVSSSTTTTTTSSSSSHAAAPPAPPTRGPLHLEVIDLCDDDDDDVADPPVAAHGLALPPHGQQHLPPCHAPAAMSLSERSTPAVTSSRKRNAPGADRTHEDDWFVLER